MILSWMLYAVVISLLLAVAARSLETVVRQAGTSTRWLWVGSMTGSVLLPVLAAFVIPRRSPPAAASPSPIDPAVPDGIIALPMEWLGRTGSVSAAVSPTLDPAPWVLAFWAAGSILILAVLLLAYARLLRRSRAWRLQVVEGHAVWVSRDTGPAVIGVLRSRIVVPEWVLEEEAERRQLILAHEREHLRARDPQLLLGALLLAVAALWNLPLWWQWQRLRQAVEVDCDLRVLARGVSPRTYSRLLVDVSERGAAHRLAVAALSESPSFLERRVRLMCTPRPRHWWPRAAGSTLLASFLVLVACRVDRPEHSPVPVTGTSYAPGADGSLQPQAPATPPPASAFAADRDEPPGIRALRAAVLRFYPEIVEKQIEGSPVNLYFVADARGEMVRTAMDTGQHVGPIDAPLQRNVGLGTEIPRSEVEGVGAQRFPAGELGPNDLNVFYVVLNPLTGEGSAAPSDVFLFFEGRRPPPEALLRAAVEQHQPQALIEAGEEGERLWFLVNERNEVLRTGRGIRPSSSREAQALLEAQFPGIRIGQVLMSSAVQTEDGRRVPLVWAQLERGSPRP